MTFIHTENINTQDRMLSRGGLTFITFPALESTGLVKHGFSTRVGGVSTDCFESLNLSYGKGDRKEAVDENFRRVSAFFNISPGNIVTGHQTHTANIRLVTEVDAGKGVTREKDYRDIDGLITGTPGLMLCTSHADCTPLFFLDPVHHAIGLSHSGWKGTLQKMGAATVRGMQESFGTDPKELITAIGPCACGTCYEVGPEVAEAFIQEFGKGCAEDNGGNEPVNYGKRGSGVFLYHKTDGKYLLDQKIANERILIEAGVDPAHISVSACCTMEESELFYSHRRMGTSRGNMAAFLMLNKR